MSSFGIWTELHKYTLGHMIRLAGCVNFSERLFNFPGRDAPDTTLDTSMVYDLQSSVSVDGNGNKITALDQNPTYLFDNHYFKKSMNQKGPSRFRSGPAVFKQRGRFSTEDLVEAYSSNHK